VPPAPPGKEGEFTPDAPDPEALPLEVPAAKVIGEPAPPSEDIVVIPVPAKDDKLPTPPADGLEPAPPNPTVAVYVVPMPKNVDDV
jgi:hypothetical protein